ncbi:MAG: hypothetical protein Q7U36_04375 [bacterium]|nr:hypothetical protein [bacterium]
MEKTSESKITDFRSSREGARNIPDDNQVGEVIYLDKEKQKRKEKREAEIYEKYKSVFDFREEKYAQDVENKNSDNKISESILKALQKHNKIVLSDGIDLIRGNNLSLEDGVAAIIATAMHDSGKLSSDVLSHHEKGIEYVDEMFLEMEENDFEFEGVKLNDEIRQKIIWAIERHMNYPWLIRKNGGKKFPEPENIVDKVVYDADMLANIGFKNVAFRLSVEDNIQEDLMEARTGSSVIEESFKNVMEDVVILDGVVLTPLAKRMATKRIDDVKKIFDYLKENDIFENVQKEIIVSLKGLNSDPETEYEKDENSLFVKLLFSGDKRSETVEIIKGRLDDEIKKAGMKLGINWETIDKLTM